MNLKIVINRCKLKKDSNNNSNSNNSSSKIVGYVEGHSKDDFNHNQSICISNTVIITPGSLLSLSIPLSSLSLVSLVLYISYSNSSTSNNNNNNNNSNKIGFGEINTTTTTTTTKDIVINILDINSGDRIGKLYCTIDHTTTTTIKTTTTVPPPSSIYAIDFINESSEFEFHELSKPIKWDKINSINIDRVKYNNNIDSIISCIDDISYGDISGNNIDPMLHSSMKLSQYSVQYLMYCQKLLTSRSTIIKSAINTFDDEEEILDIKIAKLRAREKALRRESKSLDEMHKNYVDVYESLDPKLCQKYLKRLGKKKEKNVSDVVIIDHPDSDDKKVFKSKSSVKEHIVATATTTATTPTTGKEVPISNVDNFDWSESDEVVDNNKNEIQLLDIDDDADVAQSKQTLKGSSVISIDSLNIHNNNDDDDVKVSKVKDIIKQSSNNWNSKPSWVDAAKVSSSVALSSLAISVDSLNINKNTETFEEDSLVAQKFSVASLAPPKIVDEPEKKEEIKINIIPKPSLQVNTAPVINQDVSFMNESWDDSSDFEEKKESSKQIAPKSFELEDFDESYISPDRKNTATDKKSLIDSIEEINTKNNRTRFSDYEDQDPISKNAENYAKNAEAKLLKSIQKDDDPYYSNVPKLGNDVVRKNFNEANRYGADTHEDSYDQLYESAEIDASMSIEIDPFAESSHSNPNAQGDDYQALSKTANAVIASYTNSREYDDQSKEDYKSEGLRTGVLNYLHRGIDRDISPSTINFNATNSGRLTDDDGDDVLLGTARLKGSFADTGSTQRSQHSDHMSSGDDIEQKLDILMSKSKTMDADEKSDLKWVNGRAPLDMIEVAHALDLFVSAVSLSPELQSQHPRTYLVFEFMNVTSSPSPVLPTLRQSFSAINYAAHLLFKNREVSLQLSKYIENEGMNIAVSISIIDEVKETAIGQAVVDLYVMIEDEKPLIRQEIDILSAEMGNVIGSAVVDVRGYQVLLRCS